MILAAVVALAVVVGLVVTMTGGDDDGGVAIDDQPSNSAIVPPTSAPSEADPGLPEIEERQPPPIDQLELVEQGFNTFVRDSPISGPTAYGSWGIVVENTADEPFEDVPVEIVFRDGAGTVVGDVSGLGALTIGLLHPGETMVLGGTLLSGGLGDLDEGTTEVAAMEVSFGEPGFNAIYGDPPPTGQITVADLHWEPTSSTDLQTTFTITSTYEHQIDEPRIYVVFRNAAGEIVGGAKLDGTDRAPFIPAGGNADVAFDTSLAIENQADIATVEAGVDPGLKAGLGG